MIKENQTPHLSYKFKLDAYMRYIFLLLVIMPILELWLILQVGSFIGAGATIFLILFTAILGAAMLRRQGFSTLFRARQKMDEGQMPAKEMAEGLMLAISGALMLTPGFVTDAIGFSLLMPWIRSKLIESFQGNIIFAASGNQNQGYSSSTTESEIIIEGEFTEEAETSDKKLL